MIVIINGSFGVGKTTVANLLCKALPGSAMYDPEWAGYILRRLPKWITLKGSGTDDYQDIDLWRRSVVSGTRLFCLFVPGLATVKKRLVERGTQIEGPEGAWIARRIIECADAHGDAHFGEPVDTEDLSAREIAEDIFKRLQQPSAPTAQTP
jgi:chloramphenicol 3-O-phosphotransferase